MNLKEVLSFPNAHNTHLPTAESSEVSSSFFCRFPPVWVIYGPCFLDPYAAATATKSIYSLICSHYPNQQSPCKDLSITK